MMASNTIRKLSQLVALLISVQCLLQAGVEARIYAAHSRDVTGRQQQLHGQSMAATNQPTGQGPSGPSVQTTSGKLIGLREPLVHLTQDTTTTTTNKNNNNNNNNQPDPIIYKFLAVPYAQAPVGQLRFKRPLELDELQAQGVRDAQKFGKTCPQFRHLTRFMNPLLNLDSDHQISEDCLQLNIFVPSSAATETPNNSTTTTKFSAGKQVPVIVWLPGEGFDFADARQFDGSYLAHQTQSIVVTVQYRVGALGFLSAPQLGITGNMGIYDQLMALRWVHRNIGAFGGDSGQVTLMGRFSGSMAISTMITAPKQDQLLQFNGKPLFQRVALLSGIAVNNWIIQSNQSDKLERVLHEALTRNYCTQTQLTNGSCLEKLSIEQLLSLSGYGWRLVEDNELIGHQMGPLEAIKSGKFAPQIEAVLLGETGAEGTLCVFRHMLTENAYSTLIDENRLTKEDLSEMIQDDAQTYFNQKASASKHDRATPNPVQLALEALVESQDEFEHLGDDESHQRASPDLRQKYLDACSSYMVKAHSKRFKRYLMEQNHQLEKDLGRKPVEIYHYELNYKPSYALTPSYVKTASHGDDIPLIFGLLYSQPKRFATRADLLMTQRMMAYIGNFVHGTHPLAHNHQSINSQASIDQTHEHAVGHQDSFAAILAGSSDLAARKTWLNPADGSKHSFRLSRNDLDSVVGHKSSQKVQNPVGGQPMDASRTNSTSLDSEQQHQIPRPIGVRVLLMRAPIVTESLTGEHQLIEYHQSGTSEQQVADEIGHTAEHGTKLSRLLEPAHYHQNYPSRVAFEREQAQVMANIPSERQRQHADHQQRPITINLVHESPLVGLLLFSACMLIFALFTYCFILSLIVFRRSQALAGGQHNPVSSSTSGNQFASSSSSCNICDDSHAGSMDAVLGSAHNKKENRGFCNVFAKLRPGQSLGAAAVVQQQQQKPQQQQPQAPTNNQTAIQCGTNNISASSVGLPQRGLGNSPTTDSSVGLVSLHVDNGPSGNHQQEHH